MDHFCDLKRAPESSLLHYTLVCVAKILDLDSPELSHGIAELPIHLKHQILNYTVQYRAEGLTVDELRALLQEEGNVGGHPLSKMTSRVQCLDMSRSCGSTLDLKQISHIHFPFLTHLSLARPGPGASWPVLLDVAVHVPNLLNLSLAYWTAPTEDPEEEDNPMNRKQTRAQYLSRLSKTLTHLQHLDMEGCKGWLSTLRYFDAVNWDISWKALQSLNLSQGPMPSGVQFEGGDETDAWIAHEIETLRIEVWINHCRSRNPTSSQQIRIEHGAECDHPLMRSVIDQAWEKDKIEGPFRWLWNSGP